MSGESVRLTVGFEGVESFEPASAVVSSVSAGFNAENVRGSICQYGHFFVSPKTAREYTVRHPNVSLEILTPEGAFRIGQLVLEQEPLKSIAEVRDVDGQVRRDKGHATVTRYGTVGYDLRTVGRWSRFGYGLLIAAGATASTLARLGQTYDPAGFLLQTAIAFAGIVVAYLVVCWLLGERAFAHASPWLNTLILVGPALGVAYWNLTLGHALGFDLPAALTLAMLAYIGISLTDLTDRNLHRLRRL